jgi:carboxylesterase
VSDSIDKRSQILTGSTATPVAARPRTAPGPFAVLCLHGFTGTPFEVKPVAHALEQAGFVTAVPLLAGHGGDTAALGRSSWTEWVAGANEALQHLRRITGRKVAIVGGSMGALIAMRLACASPDTVTALVLMAPPLRLRLLEECGIRLLARLSRPLGLRLTAALPKVGGADVRDPAMRGRVPSLPEYPIEALTSLASLMAVATADAGSISTPTLIVHGRHDRTVPLAVSDELASRLGSPVCRRLTLDRSGHLVALDYDRELLAETIVAFLREFAVDA